VGRGLNQDQIKQAVTDFYKREARSKIKELVSKYAQKMYVIPTRISITGARTRWGSCSSKGSVNFSWYLIMGSEEEIEYVVVHELAHLKEMNHSAKFWSIVSEFVPDYKEKRRALRNLNKRLQTENW
jgi:predicted metal-dependent hydrolase